jgi:hypothetical protein
MRESGNSPIVKILLKKIINTAMSEKNLQLSDRLIIVRGSPFTWVIQRLGAIAILKETLSGEGE